MGAKTPLDVTIRAAMPEDSSVCGQICYDAFSKLNCSWLSF